MKTTDNIKYTYLKDNYEPERKHLYFKKTMSVVERGPLRKIYRKGFTPVHTVNDP